MPALSLKLELPAGFQIDGIQGATVLMNANPLLGNHDDDPAGFVIAGPSFDPIWGRG